MSEDRSLFSVPAVAYTLAILCTVLWGSAFPSIKLGYELFQIDPSDTWSKLVYAAVRFTLAGVLVLVVRLFVIQREQRVRIASLKGEQWGRLALLGLLQTTIHYYFFYISLSFITGAKGSILSASNVFWSAILAHLFFHNDKISRGKILGIIAGFASVILVNYDVDFGFEFSVQGELFMLTAAFLASASFVFAKRLTAIADPMLITGIQLTFGGSLLLLIASLAGGSFPVGSFKAYLLLLYLASLSAAAFSIWTQLLKHNKVSSIVIFHFLVPIVGTFLSVLILGEKVFKIQYLIALPLVAGGIYLVNRTKR